jgi:voltage-gated potassium channel
MKFTRENVFKIIDKPEDGNTKSIVFGWFLTILIILNIAAVIGSSFDDIPNKYSKLLTYFEYFSVAIFTIEFLLRVWTAPYKFPPSSEKPSFFAHNIFPYVRYIFLSMGLFDLLAILPFYLPFFIADLRFLRILRLFRLLRLVKLTRYSKVDLIVRVLKKKKEELFLIVLIVGIMLLLVSPVVYVLENPKQPGQFPNILATLWWAVITLTTVGYGNVVPETAVGQLLSGIISIFGIILIALPSGIITSGFIEEYKKYKKKGRKEFKKAILDELNDNLLKGTYGSELEKGQYVKEDDLITDGKCGGKYVSFDFKRFAGCHLLIGSFSKNSPFKDTGIWMMLFVNIGVGKVDGFRKRLQKPKEKDGSKFRGYLVDLQADNENWVELTSNEGPKYYKEMGTIDLPLNNRQLCFNDKEVLDFYRDNYSDVASVIGKRASFYYNDGKGFIWDNSYTTIIDFLEKYVGNNKDIK